MCSCIVSPMNPHTSAGRDEQRAVVRVALVSGVESIAIRAFVPSVLLCYCNDGVMPSSSSSSSSHHQMMTIEQGDTIEVCNSHLHEDGMGCVLIEWRH